MKEEVEKGKAEMAKLKPEQGKEYNELGPKVKEKDWELGKLKKELYPDFEQEMEEALTASWAAMGDREAHYRSNPNHPAYVKALKLLTKKKEILTQIEKDFRENKKSPEQLLKELEKMRGIKTM